MKKINLNQLSMSWNEKQMPQKFKRYAGMLIILLTLGVGQMWAATQKYIYVGISDNYQNYKVGSKFGLHVWGGTDGDKIMSLTWVQDDYNWDGRDYTIYRAYVYDNATNAQFKAKDDWWSGSLSVSWTGTDNNAVFFSDSKDGWGGEFTQNYQYTSSSSMTASNTNVATGTSVTLTSALTSNTTYNVIKSTTYAVTTNPGSGGTVTSGGVFSASKAGTYTVTATITYNAKGFTGITKTATPTATITVYSPYTISSGSTVVWDLCANEKSWSSVYLFKDVEGTGSNESFTQCGSTTQYRKTYESDVTKIKSFLFRNNTSNWNDYTQTTDINKSVSGVTLYEFDGTYTGTKLNWQETTSAKKATSGTKVYFDNTATANDWEEIWIKYGTTRFNRHTGARATKVTGTDNLYVITMPEAYYVGWYFADNYGWTGRNTYQVQSGDGINNRINYQTTNLTEDITFVPSSGAGTPKVWTTTTFSGHTRRLTFGSHTNGQITVRYTDESGVERTVSSASADYVDVAQTCNVIITAVPNSGYAPSGLELNSSSITSGATQTIRANGTIDATFVAEETHDVTVSYMYGTRELHADATFEVGITTASDISAEVIDGFQFSAWSDLTNVTNNSANLTTNPININTIESGSDGSMTCNYTPWTCSLDLVASEGATGYSSRTAMSYDATKKAYYLNRTTASATERYRFYINSIEYAPSSNLEVDIAGTQVTANTNVTGYASNKPSVYFNDGGSGSNITIWFDYENKKAWVTEQKHTVTISAGANGSVSPTSVSVGNVVASGTITATANDHYHWSSWTVPGGVTVASGSGTRQITIKATADSKTVTANFAGDQYTITYKDQGDVAYSGNNEASLPKTHTYGTATALVNGTKTGYDFVGWYTDASCSSSAGSSIGANAKTADFTLYAKWSAKSYSTSNNIKNADGSNAGTYTATYDATSIALNSAPSKTGYNITNYYEENTFTTLIANTDRSLTSATTTYTSGGKWKYTSAPDLYVKWTAKTYTVKLDDNGSYTSDGTATATYDSNTLTSITDPQRTGYSPEGYYTNAVCTTKVATPAGDLQASTDYTTSGSLWKNDNDATLYTKWTANKYTVTLKPNGATTGSDQTVSATYDAAMPDTTTSSTSVVAPSKTGYDFTGFWDNSTNGSGTKYYNANLSSAHIWDKATNSDLWAQWSAKSYTITLNVDQTNKGSIDGATGSVSATYDATMPSIGGTLPTGANGYRYMGMYTAANGEGVALTDSLNGWKSDVDGYISDGKWVYAGTLTLYAYYQKAEITRLVLSPSTQAPGEDVTATPTIYPTPMGTTKLCWKLLRANGNEITGVTFTPTGEDDAVSFDAPEASGSYKVAAILRTGSACGAGTVLDSVVADLVVAGSHTVTIRYVDGDGRAVAASTSMEGRPLDWSDAIEPAAVTGYTFARWDAGDGISITDDNGTTTKTTTTTASIKVKASYDGTLTAVYNKKKMIYFNNTLGWNDVWVYFYSNNKYWDTHKTDTYNTEKGCGADKTWTAGDSSTPYTGKYGHMTNITGTNIWYFDYVAESISDYTNIVFCKDDKHDNQFFHNTEVVRVVDGFTQPTSLPMYVPLNSPTQIANKTSDSEYAVYYTQGYWMNYPNNTGYTLKIYNGTGGSEPTLQSIPFEFNEDKTLPMELAVELNANRTYGFEIYRNDGQYLGISGTTFKNRDSGDEGETVRATNTSGRTGLQTSVAGEYIFKLNFGNSSGYKYLLGVHYPVAVGSYRIVYTESGETLWSGHSKPAGWHHPSRSIEKKDGAKDIVSFYVKQDDASMRFQYASAVNPESGAVTWVDVAGGTIDLSSITESGVYNFHLTQTADAISVEKIEPYTGNYYIRTDNAGTTKWDNYRAADHQMTYSEFSKDRATNTFGELYTHYYMHWCPRGTNIKFVIANDYSMCITDTLENDLVDLHNMVSAGWLNSDEASEVYRDKFSANIRFMYDERTNKISRAYMSSSTNTARKFLVLRSNEEFWNSDGTDLTGSGEIHDDENNVYEAIFKDNEDWIYEREVKLTPGKLFKIYASYAQETVQEEGSQHFRGEYADNAWTKDETAVELIGGDGSACKARIIYDFKTNRLMAAYLPDNSEITGTLDINADIMIIREHQEAGQQITFKTNESQLTDVKTVYGVMRFNRWILNNRQHPEDGVKEHGDTDEHIAEFHPLVDAGSMKSVYDRALYWVSFPFDVNLSEVFGFGTYGVHWIMMDYNGAERARIGYWKDNEDGFWEYIEDRRGVTLEKGKGYVLALELDLMQANDNTFWSNQIQQVELFFPSNSSTTGTIKQTAVDVDVPDHECTIDRRTDKTVANWDKDRRVADSHWNIIGVPSYANYGRTLEDESGNTISWNSNPKVDKLPFLYEWNSNDNTYTVQSGTTFTFKAMHAYYVQYTGRLHWTLASATPSSIVARRTYAEEPQEIEFKLELQQNEKMVDQTFVKLSNDEEVSANFVFGEDMDKEFNAGKANVYTFIEGYIPTAGNTLPMSEQTTIIPMGVKIQTAGEYTFSIPNGTEGVGVTLIDNEAGTRTSLSALDYTVNLTAGRHDGRFALEISPVNGSTTDVEKISDEGLEMRDARKVIIDQKLFIIKGDKMYDARGAMVK